MSTSITRFTHLVAATHIMDIEKSCLRGLIVRLETCAHVPCVTVFVTESVRCRHRRVIAGHTWGRTERGWPRGTRWTSSGHTRRKGARLEWGRVPVTKEQRWDAEKLIMYFLFTSKWSFPTLKVNVTLPWVDLSSCSMLSKVEWSRKTSGFCFAELTKSSVSEWDFEKMLLCHLHN